MELLSFIGSIWPLLCTMVFLGAAALPWRSPRSGPTLALLALLCAVILQPALSGSWAAAGLGTVLVIIVVAIRLGQEHRQRRRSDTGTDRA